VSQSSQTNLQCPATTTNRAQLLEDDGAKVYTSFAGPDAETSLAVLMEPFQFGGIHMMCWVIHCTVHAMHTVNREFVFEVPSGTC
jgi:hypothetical protein